MKDQNNSHPLITVNEAAEILRLSRYTLNNWMSQGRIQRLKVGGRTFLAREEIEGMLNRTLQGKKGVGEAQPKTKRTNPQKPARSAGRT